MKKLKEILSKDLTQRLLYLIALLFWIFTFWNDIIEYPVNEGSLSSISSIGVSYMVLLLVPSLILLIQIIRNNKVCWGIVFALFSSFILYSIMYLLIYYYEKSGIKVTEFNDLILIVIYFSILISIDYLIYLMKPKRLI
ncbi:MAG: hypothetical protein WC121_11275 [Candidatus Kapaibacterium sp.]